MSGRCETLDRSVVAGAVDGTDAEMKAIVRKLSFRLLPLLILGQLFAYLDRVNLGFASITANEAIGINTIQYSFGVCVFFLSYFLCEYPNNKTSGYPRSSRGSASAISPSDFCRRSRLRSAVSPWSHGAIFRIADRNGAGLPRFPVSWQLARWPRVSSVIA